MKKNRPLKTKLRKLGSNIYDIDKRETNFSLGEREVEENNKRTDKQEKLKSDFSLEAYENVQLIAEKFFHKKNDSCIIHPISFEYEDELFKVGYIVFLKEVVKQDVVSNNILKPLTTKVLKKSENHSLYVRQSVLQSINSTESINAEEVVKKMVYGFTALFLPNESKCVLIDTTYSETRQVGEPKNELAVRGSQEGFVESLESNISLIRKYIRTNLLIVEPVEYKGVNQEKVAIAYLEGITNTKLIEEVKRRINSIDFDFFISGGVVSQIIEDSANSLMPTSTMTERPDRSVAMLLDGHVLVFVENTPFAIICPTTFWTLFHTSDEINMRTPYANFIRIVRILAMFFALLSPGVYISLVNYQPEMIPSDLVIHIAGSREMLPFPSILEVIIMELSFEFIYEAGIRLPRAIGSTIGIVGALILGQAAVQANLISPLLVILVSITGLSSYVIPNQDLSYAVRIGRFLFLLLGSIVGFFGIAIGVLFTVTHLVTLQSFGVPFLSPRYPYVKSNNDTLLRKHLWKDYIYGQQTRPQKFKRTFDILRKWDNR